MMNYHAKYKIGECAFKKSTNPAMVGIFSYYQGDTLPRLDDPLAEIKICIRHPVTIESFIGGGAGFPSTQAAVDIISIGHLDLLETYIKTIHQGKLYFFDDGGMYSIAIMQILVQIAKKLSKHVTCFGILPPTFERKMALSRFSEPWEVVNELADESYIFDFESTEIYHQIVKNRITGNAYYSSRWNEVLRQLVNMEHGFDSYDRFSKQI